MAQNSKIEWTHHTANLWHGCTKVHAGCDNCYAETLSKRWGREIWGNDKPRMAIKSVWNDLRKFQKEAAAVGEVHRVFVGSMMDIFEKPMPLVDSKGEDVLVAGQKMTTENARQHFFFNVIPDCPNLLFLLLTKRPSNINKYIPESWKTDPPKNVMFGTSPCDQKTADTLIPQLLQVNGKRFLSIEPLLGTTDITNYIQLTDDNDASHQNADKRGWGYDNWSGGFVGAGTVDSCYDPEPGIHWVIVGGESGHGARPMHPDWVRTLRDQCKSAEVPFFFKQYGEYAPVDAVDPSGDAVYYDEKGDERKTPLKHLCISHDGSASEVANDVIKEGEENCILYRFGKKISGRVLDDAIYDEFPK